MANMAGLKRGQLAFDPFAGTASILVALAHFGMDLGRYILKLNLFGYVKRFFVFVALLFTVMTPSFRSVFLTSLTLLYYLYGRNLNYTLPVM